MLKHFAFPLAIFLTAVFLTNCARQTTPTGGPKDTIPPTKLSSYPEHNSVNVNPKQIQITFDEHISLNNPKEQIIITPDINKEYDIAVKKKTVTLTLKRPLETNTTYLINFRESIQDITERNKADTLKLAFSTGTYIDSLTLSGRVFNSYTNKEIKDATVALYTSDTFNIFKHKPSYITKANNKGSFKFENLKHGQYYVYSFEDANRNLIVDTRSEAYAFDTTKIILDSNQKNINLEHIRLDARPLKITSARPYNTYFNIKLAKFIDSYSLRQTEGNDTLATALGDDRSSIKVYKTFDSDSVLAKLSVTDSIGHRIDTALYVKFSTRTATPEPFQIKSSNWSLPRHTGILTGKIQFNKPIALINYDSIVFAADSTTQIPFTEADLKIDQRAGTISVRKHLDKTLLTLPVQTTTNTQQTKPKEPDYSLLLKKSAFLSIELDTSAAATEQIRPFTREQSGVISVEIQTQTPSYIIQLLSKTMEIVAQERNKPKVVFEDLKPGEYLIRLVIDSNNDGKWTPGNFLKKTNTERIIYYQDPKRNQIISLKANWELGPLLIKH